MAIQIILCVETNKRADTDYIYISETIKYLDIEHKKAFDDIGRFCEVNGYEMIWFCHDIEDVYIGKKISDSRKVQEASAYRKKNRIEEMDLAQLSGDIKRAHTSNILCVLDRYYSRK